MKRRLHPVTIMALVIIVLFVVIAAFHYAGEFLSRL